MTISARQWRSRQRRLAGRRVQLGRRRLRVHVLVVELLDVFARPTLELGMRTTLDVAGPQREGHAIVARGFVSEREVVRRLAAGYEEYRPSHTLLGERLETLGALALDLAQRLLARAIAVERDREAVHRRDPRGARGD